jgi:hypothetical protein
MGIRSAVRSCYRQAMAKRTGAFWQLLIENAKKKNCGEGQIEISKKERKEPNINGGL